MLVINASVFTKINRHITIVKKVYILGVKSGELQKLDSAYAVDIIHSNLQFLIPEVEMAGIPITKQGFEKISEELKTLKKVDRPDIIKKIAEARSHGDLSENAEYHAARERQSFIEGRIGYLEGIIADAQVIDVSKLSGDKVLFGATVVLMDVDNESEIQYTLVGEVESDPKMGKISVASPIGRSLVGKAEGDEVKVVTPSGIREYEILKVKYI